jgi:anti-sigma28 factor (negative regulator of flagellin synthesis)
MTDSIRPLGPDHSPGPVQSADRPARSRPTAASQPPQSDAVELTPDAADLPPDPALERRIAELRAQIAAGTYLTPEKLEITIERLRQELTEE